MTSNTEQNGTRPLDPQENDWLLESYVRSLNGTDGEILMTLLIDGFLVSGLLVGGNRYFQEVRDRYLEDGAEKHADSIDQLQARIDAYIDDRFKPEIPVHYLHMLFATFHHPLGAGVPRAGASFRAKLNKVSGFYFGGYMPQQLSNKSDFDLSTASE